MFYNRNVLVHKIATLVRKMSMRSNSIQEKCTRKQAICQENINVKMIIIMIII